MRQVKVADKVCSDSPLIYGAIPADPRGCPLRSGIGVVAASR